MSALRAALFFSHPKAIPAPDSPSRSRGFASDIARGPEEDHLSSRHRYHRDQPAKFESPGTVCPQGLPMAGYTKLIMDPKVYVL